MMVYAYLYVIHWESMVPFILNQPKSLRGDKSPSQAILCLTLVDVPVDNPGQTQKEVDSECELFPLSGAVCVILLYMRQSCIRA